MHEMCTFLLQKNNILPVIPHTYMQTEIMLACNFPNAQQAIQQCYADSATTNNEGSATTGFLLDFSS